MPPRKSNVSTVSTTNEEGTPTKEPKDGVNIEDLSLPKTMVQRLAKGVLPLNTQITKDAALAMQKGATVFVNYLAQAYVREVEWRQANGWPRKRANATAQTNNRRTIPPPAVFEALQELEFEFMCDWVSKELNKFNDTNTGKRNEYRRKLKEEEKAKKQIEGDEGGEKESGEGEEREGEEGERAAKRARISDGGEMDEDEGGERRMNGHEERMNGHDRGDDEVIDLDAEEEEVQEEQEEQEEDEIEEEEDDEDEFPDEGRRLSSVEADEMLSDGDVRREAASEDEAMSDEGSD